MTMAATWGSMNGIEGNGVQWLPVVVLSVCFHAALLSLMVFLPQNVSIRRPSPGIVYDVQLVDMPGGGKDRTTPGPAKPAASPPKEAKAASPIPAPEPAKRVAEIKREEKPVVVAKRTVQKETRPAKKPEASPSDLIDQAISRIDRKVQSQTSPQPAVPRQAGDPLDRAVSQVQDRVRSQGGGTGGAGGAGGFLGTVMQIYQARVTQWIAGNWSYPVALQRDTNLEATVLLLVQRDGAISRSRFVRRSSDPIFDESVLRAVERSNPLPPFPESYTKSYEEFEIRFTLEELEKM